MEPKEFKVSWSQPYSLGNIVYIDLNQLDGFINELDELILEQAVEDSGFEEANDLINRIKQL